MFRKPKEEVVEQPVILERNLLKALEDYKQDAADYDREKLAYSLGGGGFGRGKQ